MDPASNPYEYKLTVEVQFGLFITKKSDFTPYDLEDPCKVIRDLISGLASSKRRLGPKGAALARLLEGIRIEEEKSPLLSENWPKGYKGVKMTVIIPDIRLETEARKFTSTLRNLFLYFDKYNVIPNITSGTRVSISLNRNFDVGELRRISKAIILLEGDWNDMALAMNKEGSAVEGATWIKDHIQSVRYNIALKTMTVANCICYLDSLLSNDRIIVAMNPNTWRNNSQPWSDRYTFNITKQNTVEFRQGIMDISSKSWETWAANALTFVRMALSTEDSKFDDWANPDAIHPLPKKLFGCGV